MNPVFVGLLGVALILVLSSSLILLLIKRRSKTKKEAPIETVDVAQRLAESFQAARQTDNEMSVEPGAAYQTAASPRSKILAAVGARELLEQVNSHVLQGRGHISSRRGEIRMEWSDLEDESVQRGIMIRVEDQKTLLINGMAFPATPQGAQEGLVSCLEGMKLE